MSETWMVGLTSLHNLRVISVTAPWRQAAPAQVYFNNKTFRNETYLRPFAQEV